MSLWRLHAIFIGSAILLCVAYAAFELVHAHEHPVPRALVGIGLPSLLAGMLAAYLRRFLRIHRG